MQTQGEFYISAAPATGVAGTVVLSPMPGLTHDSEMNLLQVQLSIPALDSYTCGRWLGTHLASCVRYLVIVRQVG